MDFELEPVTEPGRRLVALCAGHASDLFARAPAHDRDATYPHETIADLIASGVMSAAVPAELGGLGVAAVRDFAAACARLGRGDGSTALAVSMHTMAVWAAARGWRAARASGDAPQEAALAATLAEVAAGRRVVAALVTEHGTTLIRPLATALRDGDGWRLTGRKHFSTGSPAATHLSVRFRFQDAQGAWRFGAATVARSSPGVRVIENWDTLGMRASGSGEVAFDNCFIPASQLHDAGPWGTFPPAFMSSLCFGMPLLNASFLGIAEQARALSLRQLAAGSRREIPAVRQMVAENEIDLAAARAMTARNAALADALTDAPTQSIPAEAVERLFADTQATKHFVTRTAIAIVDRAMTLAGGAAFMQANPLSRLYRDARAGPFMQPYAPLDALDMIGGVTLGGEPQ